METPCLCSSEGHKSGDRKLTKTYVIEFCYKKACNRLLRAHKHLYEYAFSYKDCSDCKNSTDVTFCGKPFNGLAHCYSSNWMSCPDA